MKYLDEVKSIKDVPKLRDKAMEMAQFIFSRSQENLVTPVPWGDDSEPSNRKNTIISDTSELFISGNPPEWTDDNRIEFGYDCPYSLDVEYGSPPHPVNTKVLIGWVQRKLRVVNLKKATHIAYKISNRISKDGIPPHPFIRPALADGETRYNMTIVNKPNL